MEINFMSFTKIILKINFEDKNEFESKEFTIGSNEWKIVAKRVMPSDHLFDIRLNLISINKQEVKAKTLIFTIDCDLNKHFYGECLCVWKKYEEWDQFVMTPNQLNSPKQVLISKNNRMIGLFLWTYNQNCDQIQRQLYYRNTFNDKDLNDLKIICGEKEFFVSKNILSGYSEVFKTMFINDTKEKNENQLIIEDITEEVMEVFLQFLYSGYLNVEDLDYESTELLEQLLVVSDKYQVLELKSIVENLIFTEIDSKNAIKLLITFDIYNSNQMKDKTIQFIARNMSLIREESLDEWKDLIKSNSELCDNVIEKMSKLIDNPKIKPETNDKDKTIQFIARNMRWIREESLDEWKDLNENNSELSEIIIGERSKLFKTPKTIPKTNNSLQIFTYEYIK